MRIVEPSSARQRGGHHDAEAEIIGTTTTYQGREFGFLRNCEVKIIAIFKGAARPDYDPDDGFAVATTDDEFERLGGIGPDDRAEVQPWIEFSCT